MDPAHPAEAFGCVTCHLGNSHAVEKRGAHHTMVRNPGDLRVVSRTCGKDACHPQEVNRVMNSVMTTNSGMLHSLYRLWDSQGPTTVAAVAAMGLEPRPPELDYFAKLCAGCHFWRPRQRGQGEYGLRGGGCSGCHVAELSREIESDWRVMEHAVLTRAVPMANCVRCHNRSARIGLSYQGQYEDDGYGTPHVQGGVGDRNLSGGRHYLELPPDVHFTAGMICIDCHTARECMGDGRAHESLADQLEITCADCHAPQFETVSGLSLEERNAAGANLNVPALDRGMVARTGQGTLLYGLRQAESWFSGQATVLYRKFDGEPLALDLESSTQPHHTLPGHERLSCQACHSPFMVQCQGCHVVLRRDGEQQDKLLGEATSGRWREYRSRMRLLTPPLAVIQEGIIGPVSPCEVGVSVFNAQGEYLPASSVRGMTVSWFDPHSTQTRSRTCEDCHLDPKSLGLGSGRFVPGLETMVRHTVQEGEVSDVLVDPGGNSEWRFNREGGRPFGQEEQQAILRVGPCLPCHGQYTDPVMREFPRAWERLIRGEASECSMAHNVP